jgi:transposase
LLSVRGVGLILAPVIAMEIDQVSRFKTADKLCADAELVPTTYGSSGKVGHGRMPPFSDLWLKCAFIEVAWVAGGDWFLAYF